MYDRLVKLFTTIGWSLGLLLTTHLAIAATSPIKFKTYYSSELVGGIDQQDALQCHRHLSAARCKLETMFNHFRRCVRSILIRYPECRQSLAFFHLTSGGIISTIKHYDNIEVILADHVYIADQRTGYFLLTHAGQFVTLPVNIPRHIVKQASGYAAIAKQYKRVGLWQIVGFPQSERLPQGGYRLIFTQQLKDGCNACAPAGTAQVAYDFSDNGNILKSIKVLRLIPKS